VGLSFFKDLIYIPKIQLTTEKKGQGMAKAKSKNPVGRPKFGVTPEVLARTERAMAQWINQRTMRWRHLVFQSQPFNLSGRKFGVFGYYKKRTGNWPQ
jgi:hypothetical protein